MIDWKQAPAMRHEHSMLNGQLDTVDQKKQDESDHENKFTTPHPLVDYIKYSMNANRIGYCARRQAIGPNTLSPPDPPNLVSLLPC